MKYLAMILILFSSCATVNINGVEVKNKVNRTGIRHIVIPAAIGGFIGWAVVAYYMD